jgi:hypothetical protein
MPVKKHTVMPSDLALVIIHAPAPSPNPFIKLAIILYAVKASNLTGSHIHSTGYRLAATPVRYICYGKRGLTLQLLITPTVHTVNIPFRFQI